MVAFIFKWTQALLFAHIPFLRFKEWHAIFDKHSSQLLAILVTHLRGPKLLKLTVETESGRLIIVDSTFRSCLCSIRSLTGAAHIYLSV